MKKNLSNTDRLVRTALGVGLLALVDTRAVTGWWASGLALLAVALFGEALLAY